MDVAGREGIGRRRVPYRLLCVTDGSRDDGDVVFRAEGQRSCEMSSLPYDWRI